MEHLLDAFLGHLRVERNLAANTLDAYGLDLAGYLKFLAEQGVTTVEQVTPARIAEHQRWLYGRGLSARSAARHLAAVRQFHRFLMREHLTEKNPTELAETPTQPKTLPVYLTIEEVDRLIAAAEPSTPELSRDRAMVELLYATGLRVSELCGLTLESINLQSEFLIARGKGRKERLVPIGRSAQKALKDYLDGPRAAILKERTSRFVFVTRKGGGIGRQCYWRRLGALARLAGITKHLSPHKLRHSFATHMLAHGADLRVVQALLGHADLSTTQIYTHVEQSSLHRTVERYHPRGR